MAAFNCTLRDIVENNTSGGGQIGVAIYVVPLNWFKTNRKEPNMLLAAINAE